jgi:hypothetical protein
MPIAVLLQAQVFFDLCEYQTTSKPLAGGGDVKKNEAKSFERSDDAAE